jgi:hypothetical protein
VESKSTPVDPLWEFPALRPTFSRVLSHVFEEDDTSEIDVASLSILTHVATCISGKVIALGGIPTHLRLCVHQNSSHVGPRGLPL